MTPTALADDMLRDAAPKEEAAARAPAISRWCRRIARSAISSNTNPKRFAKTLDKSRPFTKDQLEGFGRTLLGRLNLPEGYLGFAMVLIGNYFWKQQFLAIPFEPPPAAAAALPEERRGLPGRLRRVRPRLREVRRLLDRRLQVRAEELGYKVLVAEGSPIVLKIIVSGYIDGILGVACLNVLEKAIDKVLLAGMPSFAMPLLSSNCKNTKMDEDWIWEVLEQYEPESAVKTSSYVPLIRAANDVFDRDLDTLVRRSAANQARKRSPSVADTKRSPTTTSPAAASGFARSSRSPPTTP